MKTLTLTMRVAWWVPAFIDAISLVARCGVTVSVERVADFVARHGIMFTTRSARAA